MIHIPKKVNRVIERYVSREVLKSIHPDLNTARELCLIILSNLSSTYYQDSRYKRLSWEIMHRQTSTSSRYVYRRILDVLLDGSKLKGPIIQQGEDYQQGHKCREWALTDTYFGKGIESYRVTTPHVRYLREREHWRLISEAADNVIARNLLRIYRDLTLPTHDQIMTEARRLVNLGHRNRKGRKLTFLNGHSKSRWKDQSSIAFVEDGIDVFDLLTANGYMIPMVGDDNSGGRVVDSFALMPSWIRSMTTIDGERMTEADFSCLHPNLIQTIYQGPLKNITHQQVADALGINKQMVKTCHLAYFNSRWSDMVKSPVHPYYMDTCPDMMEAIRQDKTKHGHKVTSRKMFRAETDLMTAIITDLNTRKVNALYVFDALMVAKPHHQLLIDTMDANAKRMGIHTSAS